MMNTDAAHVATTNLPVRSIPWSRAFSSNDELCTHCGYAPLERHVDKGRVWDGEECYSCRYRDRPYGMNSVRAHECTCHYNTIDCLYITCKRCNGDICYDCGCPNENTGYHSSPWRCQSCDVQFQQKLEAERKAKQAQEKEEMRQLWRSADTGRKLRLHGVKKLQVLAKKKGIRKYSKLKKAELVALLEPVTTSADFPIDSGESKIYLNVQYHEKDAAKALGAQWDSNLRHWYTTTANRQTQVLIDTYGLKDGKNRRKENMTEDTKATSVSTNQSVSRIGNRLEEAQLEAVLAASAAETTYTGGTDNNGGPGEK